MRRLLSLAAPLMLTGCAAAFPRVPMPAVLAPSSAAEANAWVASTRPTAHAQLRFHWSANNQEQSGRGVVLIAPPDSLRLEYRGPLGMSPGTVAVVGDSALWAQPRDEVQKIVPNYPLLWAMVGVALPPGRGWKVVGHRDATTIAWRYTRGADTVDYVWSHASATILEAYVSEGGKPIGRVTTILSAEGHPAKSRLDVLSEPARLDLTFDKASKPMAFDREFWIAPHDQ